MRKLLLPVLLVAATVSASDRSHFPYIYKHGNATHMRSGEDIETMVKRSKRWTGEFVWLRKDGREYLIRDATVLAAVRAAFAEMHAFEPRLRAATEKREPWEQRIDALERQMDRISDQLGDDEDLTARTRESLQAKLRELERQFADIEDDYHAVEREAERMEEEMDRLEVIAEARFDQIVLRAVRDGKAERVR